MNERKKEGLYLSVINVSLKKLKDTPPVRLIVSSFFVIIVLGAALLMLPISSRQGVSTNFINSIFTATSATCVTGLVVYDTFTHWSAFGQVVILLLIQIGGLGLITFTSGFTLAMRRKLDLRDMLIVKEYTSGSTIDIPRLIRTILFVSFVCEALGTMLLMLRFIPMFGRRGIWISIFLAVSAYCNAGFDILGFLEPGSSLGHFATDPLVSITLCLLIIFGGIGFIVITDLYSFVLKKMKHNELHPHLTLHSKIVLVATVSLLLSGMLIIFLLEYDNTLKDFGFLGKLTAAFFQSCTVRTAGFTSVSQAKLFDITKIVTIILMFIGASPSSTGGGIKTTTFVVLVWSVISVLRGRDDTEISRRRVDKSVVYKSLTIASLAILVIAITTSIITINDYKNGVSTLDALFESVSAFSTAGISADVTNILSIPSKITVIITMFIGRVGPISLVLALTLRHTNRRSNILPEGRVIVG